VSALVPGLYGKMPSHGDFVRRGWREATADALDRWLGDGAATLREEIGEDAYADRMRAAPLWHGFLPGGTAGAEAVQLALAPSIDRAGRLFFLAAGVAGDDAAAWAHLASASGFAERLDRSIYAALAGTLDADGVVAAVTDAAEPVPEDAGAPGHTCWWPAPPAAGEVPAVIADRLDRPLFDALMRGGSR